MHLTPEGAVGIQEQLGADIQMVLDVCAPLPSDRAMLRARRRPHRASGPARARAGASPHATTRRCSASCRAATTRRCARSRRERTVELDFDGYAIGGLSVGETRDEMLPALEAAVAELPADQPRYFMGLGDPVGHRSRRSPAGLDMFDCVLPTRLGRHGTLLTDAGRLNIKRAEFARSDEPIDPTCVCEVCARYSRGYLRHLCAVGEPAAATLCTLHNLAWLLGVRRRTCAPRSGPGHLDAGCGLRPLSCGPDQSGPASSSS